PGGDHPHHHRRRRAAGGLLRVARYACQAARGPAGERLAGRRAPCPARRDRPAVALALPRAASCGRRVRHLRRGEPGIVPRRAGRARGRGGAAPPRRGVRRGAGRSPGGGRRAALGAMERVLEQTAKLVEELLLIARGENRQLAFAHAPFDLTAVVDEVREITEAMAVGKDLVVSATPSARRWALGDAGRTRHI